MPRRTKFIEPLSCRVTVRFTPSEFERVKRVAELSQMSIGEVVRRRTLHMKIPRTNAQLLQEVSSLRSLAAQHTGLFKHLYNTNPAYSKETAAGLQDALRLYKATLSDYDTLRVKIFGEIYLSSEEEDDDL